MMNGTGTYYYTMDKFLTENVFIKKVVQKNIKHIGKMEIV